MYNSITYFAENGIPQLEEIQKTFIQSPSHLEQLVENVKQVLLEFGCHIVSETLKECNCMIEDSIKRRIHWHIKDRTERTLLTSMGLIRFPHTRYTKKETKETAYLLDRILDLPAHTRLSADAKTILLREAAQSSYQRAGEMLPEPVSKETVMRTVHSLHMPAPNSAEPDTKRKADILYVEADEDHIALQFHEKKGDVKRWKGHGDNGQIVKLVYVHEGIMEHGKRRQLKNPFYFGGIYPGKENETLWKEVHEYIRGTYETESLEEIRFQSDGGGWMKKGGERMGASFVLDGFHLRKYVKGLCRVSGEEEKEVEVTEWIRKNQKRKLESWVKEKGEVLEEKRRRKQEETWRYLKRNWKGIQNRVEEHDRNIGSSTEGHISHILSSRMSSRPMGWSKKGADSLSRLRIYWKNGGEIEKLLVKKEAGKNMEEDKSYLSAQELITWERRSRRKNGKYIEALQAKVSQQTGAKVYFHSAIAGVC